MKTIFKNLFLKSYKNNPSKIIFESIISQSRKEVFFRDLEVQDNIDGRFEMIVFHAFLVTRRMQSNSDLKNFSRDIMTHIFDNFDLSLREVGVGDMGLGKKIKNLADSLYGSFVAYKEGFDKGEEVLQDAINRNIYRGKGNKKMLKIMATYAFNQNEILNSISEVDLLDGKLTFTSPL